MSIYDWNRKNDVISDFIKLKTNQKNGSVGEGLGCFGVLLLFVCAVIFVVMLILNCRIWTSLLVSVGTFFSIYLFAKYIHKFWRKQKR